MEGKICFVTGATSGIGLAVATALAHKRAAVVVGGRNPQKCEYICAKIRTVTNNAKIDYLIADLSSQKEVRRLADHFNNKYDRLDVLVNNAGAKFASRVTTVDGNEMTFALNHLSYFLLTQLLLPRLHASSSARIINVASEAHHGAKIDFKDLQNENNYIGKKAYNQSKLANVLFTYELSRRLNGSSVTVNAMAPGGVITNFCRNNGWVSWLKHVGAHILARNLIGPKTAAETIVYLATSDEVQSVSGKYFFEKKTITSSLVSYDKDSANKLWEISMELTRKAFK
jgi:NAD(P)-dependent dehydrogenase (short-subunit alcohol dehydrogenase family)